MWQAACSPSDHKAHAMKTLYECGEVCMLEDKCNASLSWL